MWESSTRATRSSLQSLLAAKQSGQGHLRAAVLYDLAMLYLLLSPIFHQFFFQMGFNQNVCVNKEVMGVFPSTHLAQVVLASLTNVGVGHFKHKILRCTVC